MQIRTEKMTTLRKLRSVLCKKKYIFFCFCKKKFKSRKQRIFLFESKSDKKVSLTYFIWIRDKAVIVFCLQNLSTVCEVRVRNRERRNDFNQMTVIGYPNKHTTFFKLCSFLRWYIIYIPYEIYSNSISHVIQYIYNKQNLMIMTF